MLRLDVATFSHLYEGIIFSMLCQILPIAVIQTPKPDLIPRLYLHRLLRLHTQPVLVGAVHGIHICQKHFVPLPVKSGMNPADRLVRQHMIDTAGHFPDRAWELFQLDVPLVSTVHGIQFILCRLALIKKDRVAAIVNFLLLRRRSRTGTHVTHAAAVAGL